jgi:hypothetical protein
MPISDHFGALFGKLTQWGPGVFAHHGLLAAKNPKTTLSLILNHGHLAYLALGEGHQSITAKQLLNGDLNVRASCLARKYMPDQIIEAAMRALLSRSRLGMQEAKGPTRSSPTLGRYSQARLRHADTSAENALSVWMSKRPLASPQAG